METKSIQLMLATLSDLAFAHNFYAEEPHKFPRDGTTRSYEHSFVIEVEKNEISAITHASMTTNGYTCEIIPMRHDNQSKWIEHNDGVEIVSAPLGHEAGRVCIETQGTNCKLTV